MSKYCRYNITNNPNNDNPQKYTYSFSPCEPVPHCGPNAADGTVYVSLIFHSAKYWGGCRDICHDPLHADVSTQPPIKG